MTRVRHTDAYFGMDDCISCGEGTPRNECPNSKRPCGHHCNCSWMHDACDWCGEIFGEVAATTRTNQQTEE